MWHFISEQISQHIRQDFICNDIREVQNGNSHRAFKISDGKIRFFIKINEKIRLADFQAEAEGLEHLSKANLFKVPKPICTGLLSEHSFLVLEHVHMTEGTPQDWFKFGQSLAKLHQAETQEMYGWQEDNFIGLTQQPNRWEKRWGQFFAEQRIGFMLQILADKGCSIVNIEQAVKGIKQLLKGHNPISSMLHGDLWHGNTGFHKQQAVLYDPAFYYGDRETDIAMTELFGRFPDTFYQGYSDIWPIDSGYQYRKPIYQLYHLLNHAILFGGEYIDTAKLTLKNLDS